MTLSITGCIIRMYMQGKVWYWTGAYRQAKWSASIYEAKIYKSREKAQSVIALHKGDCTWNSAEIVNVRLEEI